MGIAPSSYPSCWKREPPSIAPNKPSGSRSTLCSSDFQPDSRHCTSLMLLPDFTGYQHPSTSSLNQWSSSPEPSTTLLLGICLISSDTLLIYRRKDVSFHTSQRPPFKGGHTISVFNQPSRPTQPSTLRGREMSTGPKCGDSLRLGSQGRMAHCIHG